MQAVDNEDDKGKALPHGPYTALHGLLEAVRSVLGTHVCLVTPHADSACVVLVSSGQPNPSPGRPYQENEADIVVPALHQGREFARLVVLDPSSPPDLKTLVGFAEAAGYILARAEETSEAIGNREEARVLRELGLQFGAHANLQDLLDAMVKSVRAGLGADYANLTTVTNDGATHWLAVDGYRTEAYKQQHYLRGRGTAARAFEARNPITLEGIGQIESLPAEDFPVHTAEGGVSVLSVPLMRKGLACGALTFGSRTPRHWRQQEVQMASVVANGLAMAIEQARASEGEHSQRAFLERVIENYPGILIVLGPPPAYRIVLANSRFSLYMPEPYRSGAPLVGLPATEINPNDSEQRQATLRLLEQVYDSGEAVSFEQFQSDDPRLGVSYWNWTAVPVDGIGEGGERVIMLIAYDVTDTVLSRERAYSSQRDARARAEELEAVFSHMADGVAIFDEKGSIVRINPAGEQLLGRGSLAGLTPDLHVERYGLRDEAGKPFDTEQLPVVRALMGETVHAETLTVLRPAGDETIIRVSCAPLTDLQGQISGAVAVFHDITQEKVVERLKDEFLSIVSHELRTPLTAIIGYSDLMMRGVHGGLGERQAKVLTSVRANADRLLRLINDLLDVSKLDSGTVQLHTEPLDLTDLVSRTLAQLRILAVNAGVSINNMLPQRRINQVMADEQKLHQVIENLVSNAIKFTPGGTITLDAYHSELEAGDPLHAEPPAAAPPVGAARSVVVTVHDTGAGLEADQLARIWDRFYQVDTTVKRRSGGAGLGLTIVRRLVELLGGQVWATSRGISRGSTFLFSLPMAPGPYPPDAQSAPTTISKRHVREDATRPALGTVLVAEDDADQREIICELLEMEGFKVALASTGDEALELALDLQPAAIALDVLLPRLDGWEVLQQLRKNPLTKDIPVLIISVVDQKEFGKKLGADDYLLKPLNPHSLRTAMRRLVLAKAPGSALTLDEPGMSEARAAVTETEMHSATLMPELRSLNCEAEPPHQEGADD